MMKILVPAALSVLALTATAGTICPGSIAPDGFGHNPDAAATGCNTLITISPDLSVAITVPDAAWMETGYALTHSRGMVIAQPARRPEPIRRITTGPLPLSQSRTRTTAL